MRVYTSVFSSLFQSKINIFKGKKSNELVILKYFHNASFYIKNSDLFYLLNSRQLCHPDIFYFISSLKN